MKKFYDPPIYYHGEWTYVQVPRLIFNPPFDKLDDDARVFYGMLLDRMEQSYEDPERWSDDEDAYVYWQREELMQKFGIAQQKATRIYKTLEENDLIRRKRQSAERKSTKIYINTYWEDQPPEWVPPYREQRRNAFNGPKRRMHSFINVYWRLFKDPYKNLSNSARILYGLLIKRVEQDEKKNALRTDKNGAYIYYPLDKIMQTLHISDKKATKTINELESAGLIKRERQGFGKPAKIRVTPPRDEKYDSPRDEKYDSPRDEKYDSPRDEKYDSTYKNLHSVIYSINQSTSQAQKDSATTGTPSESGVVPLCREEVETQVVAQIDKQALYQKYPPNKATIDSIAEIMVDELTSTRPAAKIGGATRTRAEIRIRLNAVTSADVAAILDAMRKNPPKVKNPRGYLLTSLYNAPANRMDEAKPKKGPGYEVSDEMWKYADELKRHRDQKKAREYAQKLKEEMETTETTV